MLGNLSTSVITHERQHAEAVHILLRAQVDDDRVILRSSAGGAVPVRVGLAVQYIFALVGFIFLTRAFHSGELGAVEAAASMRFCLPTVFLGVDGTVRGENDITRICSKIRKMGGGGGVNIVDSSSEKESRGPLELHLRRQRTMGLWWCPKKRKRKNGFRGWAGVEISEHTDIGDSPARLIGMVTS